MYIAVMATEKAISREDTSESRPNIVIDGL